MYTARGRHYAVSRNNPQQQCLESTGTIRSQSKPSSIVDEEVPLITQKGDRIHATPFAVLVRERSRWDGAITANAYQPSAGPCVNGGAYCGTTADCGFLYTEGKVPNGKVDTALMDRIRGISETKALADVRRSYNNIPLLLIERRETLSMIAKRARTLSRQGLKAQRDALMRWYATSKKNRPQAAKDIASLHLEFLFGWLPVIGEIEGLCDQLAAGKTAIITGRGRMANDETVKDPMYVHPPNSGVLINGVKHQISYAVATERRVRHSARTSLRYELDIPAVQKMRDNGFNPLAVLYDIVPLSFLSEFISNLGTWIRSFDPLIGVKYITGSTSTWFEEIRTSVMLPKNVVDSWGYQIACSGRGSQTARQLHVRRFVHAVPPESSFWFTNQLSLSKAATIAALAIQRAVKPLRKAVRLKPFRYRGPRPKYLPPINYQP